MHTQHFKVCEYVGWDDGVGGVVAMGVVFEEGLVAAGSVVDDD